MKTVIQNQRKERDRLLALPYLTRQTSYNLPLLLANHNIKLLTGPRRVGKSTQALLLLRDKNFAYLNFDDNRLIDLWDEDRVMQCLDEVYPNYEYLLLDEVQNLSKWDIWVSKLFRQGINMVITGSNANLLSGEMATLLTGRYIEIKMLPFGLNECMRWNGIDVNQDNTNDIEKTSVIDSFIKYGGYPESVAQRSITDSYLQTLFDSIIFKDIVKRHKIRNIEDLNDIAAYLLSNFCNTLSFNDVAHSLGIASTSTTQKFMNYLHEPYLFYYLPRYNKKLQLMKKAPTKVYIVDNGFVNTKAFNLSENLGRLLENLVFIELLRQGYNTETSLFYYRSRNDKETDFIVRNGTHIINLIQVCYDLRNPKTEKREVDSLIECAEELKCQSLSIISYDEERTIEKKGFSIQVIPISKFCSSKTTY